MAQEVVLDTHHTYYVIIVLTSMLGRPDIVSLVGSATLSSLA
jgi:hypothetical protein